MFRQWPHLNRIARALQHRAAFGKFHGFVYGIGFNDNITAYGFLNFAERAVGYYVIMPYHPAVVKQQSFEEAVRTSNLTPEQQSYLLKL